MQWTESTVIIRPRSAWEALDMGVLLAGRYRRQLISGALAIYLPMLALLSAILWQYPGWCLLAIWWLKPIAERLTLLVLAKAVFGQTPTLRQALGQWLNLRHITWLADLTWRRFNPTRSLDLPVDQLEGLRGQPRWRRLKQLHLHCSNHALYLTAAGLVVELLLMISISALLYTLLPPHSELDGRWTSLLGYGNEWLWLEHGRNLLYVLVLAFWQPIYVAAGFSLYLNRRTQLEGWDLELALRGLARRLTGVVPLLGIILVVLLCTSPGAWANAEAPTYPGPEAARLQQQPLTSEAAANVISELLQAPPFVQHKTVTGWRWVGTEQAQAPASPDNWLAKWLARMFSSWLTAQSDEGFDLQPVASTLAALLWAALAAAAAYLLWRARQRLPMRARPTTAPLPLPEQLLGLNIAPQHLPTDVAAEARRLWSNDPRAALALLYRALLSRLVHQDGLPLESGHTEGDVVALVARHSDAALGRYTAQLTQCWQAVAYGHRAPGDGWCEALCRRWQDLQ